MTTSTDNKQERAQRLRGLARAGGVVLVLGLLSSSLITSLMAEPATSPRDKDRERATRTASPKAGGQDERLLIPQGVRVSGNGVVEPASRAVELSAEVPGVIAQVLVREGQRVRAGDPLVKLSEGTLAAALDAAAADVAIARAQLDRARNGPRPLEIREQEAQARAARAQATLSAERLKRNAPLLKQGVLSAEEFNQLKRQAEQLDAAADAAEARARLTRQGTRREDVAIARAQLKAAEARAAQARSELERRTVRAPLDAEVLQLKRRPGEYTQPGAEALAVLGDTSALRVRLDIDERDIGRVRVGDQALIQAIPFPDKLFKGQVVEIGRRMGRKNVRTDDPTERVDTKILEILIALDDPGALLPGLRVRGYLQGGDPKR